VLGVGAGEARCSIAEDQRELRANCRNEPHRKKRHQYQQKTIFHKVLTLIFLPKLHK